MITLFSILLGLLIWAIVMVLIVAAFTVPAILLFFAVRAFMNFINSRNTQREFVRDYKSRKQREQVFYGDDIPEQTSRDQRRNGRMLSPGEEEAPIPKPQPKPAPKKPDPKPAPAVPPSEDFIRKLNTAKADIHDDEIDQSIDQTIELLNSIKSLNDTEKQTEKMYSTYLPSLISILQGYSRLEITGNQEELAKSKEKILRVSGLVNTALEKVINDLRESHRDVLDTDIRQLETLLKNDIDLSDMNSPFSK